MRIDDTAWYAVTQANSVGPGFVDCPNRGKRFLIYSLDRPGDVRDWVPIGVTSDSDTPKDLPVAAFTRSLVSDRMRGVIEPRVGPKDVVEWLPEAVAVPSGKELRYWHMRFPEQPELLHPRSTWSGSGIPMVWFLDEAKLEGHVVWSRASLGWTVMRGDLVQALLDAGITGMDIEPARIAGSGAC